MVVEMLRLKGQGDALGVLTQADVETAEIGYDNWNGGTAIWKVNLRVPVHVFVPIENERECLADTIRENLETVLGAEIEYWVRLEITLPIVLPPGSRIPDGRIRSATSAAVLNEMRARKTVWYGALDDERFLSRIFDLTSMPSFDPRFETARDDIRQHRINNDDWTLDWVFDDPRMGLYRLDQTTFLRFVSEVLHPIVRTDVSEQSELATAFNGHLRSDGWELVEDVVIDGRPTYVPERKTHGLRYPVRRIKAVAASLGSDDLYKDIRRLEQIGDTEPGEAIGLAKEIVEGCCKLILDDRNVTYDKDAKIPKLLKLLTEEIQIMPVGIGENARASKDIRDVLTSLGKMAHALAPIRNAYGKGHGRGRNFKGLEPRHARLAIGAASTFADFVLDRHRTLAMEQGRN